MMKSIPHVAQPSGPQPSQIRRLDPFLRIHLFFSQRFLCLCLDVHKVNLLFFRGRKDQNTKNPGRVGSSRKLVFPREHKELQCNSFGTDGAFYNLAGDLGLQVAFFRRRPLYEVWTRPTMPSSTLLDMPSFKARWKLEIRVADTIQTDKQAVLLRHAAGRVYHNAVWHQLV